MSHRHYTRRAWLRSTMARTTTLAVVVSGKWPGLVDAARMDRVTRQHARLDPAPAQALARQAVDVARQAGAHYADARLTRVVQHQYTFGNSNGGAGTFQFDTEAVGLGVRALVGGYWGFAAFPVWESGADRQDTAARIARDAVAQAKINAQGPRRVVDLGPATAVTGTWATPVRIDPFTITIEEKLDMMAYWGICAQEQQLSIWELTSGMHFVRQERVVATSDGSCVTQTCFESHGLLVVQSQHGSLLNNAQLPVLGLESAGKGWELFLDAKIPEQFVTLREQFAARRHDKPMGAKPIHVGRYTLVCDGGTMASLVAETLGVATQLDRALGYEADAGGTSFLNDPLAMVGQFQVAGKPVTVTANRSAPAQLATVQWDDEGVTPSDVPLIKDGVLVDFQTTREQAAWLAAHYQSHGRPARSNGCAAAQDALHITLQMMPNLALMSNPAAVGQDDLVAEVANGILIKNGEAGNVDFQARTGLLMGEMYEIKNGKIGRPLEGGAVQFDTLDCWRNVLAVGGSATGATRSYSQYNGLWGFEIGVASGAVKGQPPQGTGYSVHAPAAVIANQAVIIPTSKV